MICFPSVGAQECYKISLNYRQSKMENVQETIDGAVKALFSKVDLTTPMTANLTFQQYYESLGKDGCFMFGVETDKVLVPKLGSDYIREVSVKQMPTQDDTTTKKINVLHQHKMRLYPVIMKYLLNVPEVRNVMVDYHRFEMDRDTDGEATEMTRFKRMISMGRSNAAKKYETENYPMFFPSTSNSPTKKATAKKNRKGKGKDKKASKKATQREETDVVPKVTHVEKFFEFLLGKFKKLETGRKKFDFCWLLATGAVCRKQGLTVVVHSKNTAQSTESLPASVLGLMNIIFYFTLTGAADSLFDDWNSLAYGRYVDVAETVTRTTTLDDYGELLLSLECNRCITAYLTSF